MTDDDTVWSLISFDKPRKADAPAPASTSPANTCPKCGRALGKGGHFHVKHCKGKAAHDDAV